MKTERRRQAPTLVLVESSVTGAGECLNRFAKAKGYSTTLLTRCQEKYSKELLQGFDRIVKCETADGSEVESCVRLLGAQTGVQGVTTTADLYTPQAARAAEVLNLPAMSYAAAVCARNKWKTRHRLAVACPTLNPKYGLAKNRRDATSIAVDIGFPVVAKPLKLNDGRGVRLLRNVRDLETYWNRLEWDLKSCEEWDVDQGILLEEFVDGPEFSVETMQAFRGDIQLIGVASKFLTGKLRRYFVEIGHSFPHLGRHQGLLFQCVTTALKALEVDCGVAHSECRVRGDMVTVMEINPRLAGGRIGSHLVELATGWNPIEAVIEIAMGNRPPICPLHARGAAIRHVWTRRKGCFLGLRNEKEIRDMPGVVDVITLLPLGTSVRPPESNADNIVAVIATGNDETVAREYAMAAARRVELQIEQTCSEFGRESSVEHET